MAHFHNNALIGAAGQGGDESYQISRSLRFNSADSAYLGKTFSSAGSTTTWTLSFWIKRVKSSGTQNVFMSYNGSSIAEADYANIEFNNSDQLSVGYAFGAYKRTNRVFRDFSSWYHIVIRLETGNSTASDRVQIYVNGVKETSFAATHDPDSGQSLAWNKAYIHRICSEYNQFYANCYLAEVHFVDGTALAASDFGKYDSNNVWQPKDCKDDLTYGTNGFYLKFADNSSSAALGTDSSGLSNTWTVNNIAAQASTYASAGTHSGKAGISFNGTNAVINLSADADVNPGSGVFTLECYAYALSGGASAFGIYDGSPGGNGSFVLRRVGAGTLMVERHNTAFDITGAAFSEGAWHHVAVTRDSSNNVRLFVDGTQSGSTSTNNTYNYQGTFRLGRDNNQFTNGYISNLRLIKGTCLYTSNFTAPTGNLTNVTNTKLLMAQSTTSATAATVKPSGLTISGSGDSTIIDSLIDTPTNYTADSGNNGGNYATINPLSTSSTLANGNLQLTTNSGIHYSTIGVSSGKWYAEWTATSAGGSQMVGISKGFAGGSYLGSNSDGFGYYGSNGQKYNGSGVSYGTTYGSGDVIGVALNLDDGNIVFYKNGTSQGTAFTGLSSGTYFFAGGESSMTGHWNFGQRPFAYTPPANYLSLCTQNLADPTIADGSTAFDVNTYAGNGSSQSISLSFEPDLIWTKGRNNTEWNVLVDQLRTTSRFLYSNATNSESANQSQGVTAFSSTGYTVGSSDYLNKNTFTYVGWAWDAGSSTVSNTAGSITSSVRANQTAGFSIATYTGNGTINSTVGHGLNAAPSLVIIKNRSNAYAWAVLHTSVGFTGTTLDGSPEYYMLQLDSNAARNNFTNDNIWNPTSSTFKINGEGTGNWVNANGDNYVAYSWAPVEGFSAFGSYTGNGSSAGPFVYTGMRPKFILAKITSGNTDDWIIYDTERSSFNAADDELYPNQSSAEVSGSRPVDILSDGFKIRNTSNKWNGASGYEYVYAAFAEHPFKTARAR